MKYILFFYSLALALFISISGFLGTKRLDVMAFQFFFLPVVLYFLINAIKILKKKNSPGGNFGLGVIFFSVIILIVLLGTSLNRIFFAKSTVSPTPQSTLLPSPTPLPSKQIIIVIEDQSPSVNIRSKATTYSDIIKKVEEGSTFDVLEEEKEWFKIKVDEKTEGYVSKRYAKLKQDE